MLKVTFVGGGTAEFPFGPESSLTVETPDGVNGVKRASWGEVAAVEYDEKPKHPKPKGK